MARKNRTTAAQTITVMAVPVTPASAVCEVDSNKTYVEPPPLLLPPLPPLANEPPRRPPESGRRFRQPLRSQRIADVLRRRSLLTSSFVSNIPKASFEPILNVTEGESTAEEEEEEEEVPSPVLGSSKSAMVVKVYWKQSRLGGGRRPTIAAQADVGRRASEALT